MMERGSNLDIPGFWEGTLSYYALCNNNHKVQNSGAVRHTPKSSGDPEI